MSRRRTTNPEPRLIPTGNSNPQAHCHVHGHASILTSSGKERHHGPS